MHYRSEGAWSEIEEWKVGSLLAGRKHDRQAGEITFKVREAPLEGCYLFKCSIHLLKSFRKIRGSIHRDPPQKVIRKNSFGCGGYLDSHFGEKIGCVSQYIQLVYLVHCDISMAQYGSDIKPPVKLNRKVMHKSIAWCSLASCSCLELLCYFSRPRRLTI